MFVLDSIAGVVQWTALATGAAPRALGCVAAMVGALALGTVIRIVAQRLRPTPRSGELLASLKTWWALIAVLLFIATMGRAAVALSFGVLSLLALREFFHLFPRAWTARPVVVAAYLIGAFQYALIWSYDGETTMPYHLAFTPLASLVIISAVRMAASPLRDFAASLGAVQLALLVSVFGLSHAACFHTLPTTSNPLGGALGWLLYLLIVTEANDMTQAFFGRVWGKHKATPRISPNKSWEGFIAGVLATVALATLLAPAITPLEHAPPQWRSTPLLNLPYFPAVAAGTIIAVGGIVGDLLMSSCKRDRGVKDFGTLLPGQGGVLDRFDSLTVTAPLFFYFVRLLDY